MALVVEKLVLEITLLGFVSLILLILKDYVPQICMSYSESQETWTLLGNVDGCPCCLSSTKGVTLCSQIYHECAFNATSNQDYCGCDLGWSESSYDPSIAKGTDCTDFRTQERRFVTTLFVESLDDLMANTSLRNETLLDDIAKMLNGNSTDIDARASCNDTMGNATGKRRALMEAMNASSPEIHSINGSRERHIIPEIQEFECEGSFYSGSCSSPGDHPAISDESLHQMHLLVFLVALMHIVTAIVVVLLAGFRMLQWRGWQSQGKELLSLDSVLSSIGTNIHDTHHDLESKTRGRLDRIRSSSSNAAVASSSSSTGRRSNDEMPANVPSEEETVGCEESAEGRHPWISRVRGAIVFARDAWIRRDADVHRKRHYLLEAVICVGQAFLPNLVSRNEFLTIRKSYILSRGLPKDHDFVEEVRLHLDFDLVRILGASLTTWIIFILQWLFTGVLPWTTWLFQMVAIFALFSMNVGLCAAVRFACRGGRAHRLRVASRRFLNWHALAIPIGGIIFLCSTVYSTSIFFIWQYGANSCIFTGSQHIWKWTPQSLLWYTSYVSAGIMLIWLAGVTVPAWALIMHMRPRSETEIVAEKPKDAAADHEGVALAGSGSIPPTQASILAEIAKLQFQLEEMQK